MAYCEFCGAEFKPYGQQKYCSIEHQKLAGYEREKAKRAIIKRQKNSPKPTDWKSIALLIKSTGKQYGQLRSEGLL